MQERIKEKTLQPGKEINERNIGSIYVYIDRRDKTVQDLIAFSLFNRRIRENVRNL